MSAFPTDYLLICYASYMSMKIVVIGGGLAGAAAAHTLTRRGYKVTIIERRNYVGGRIHSELVDGAAVEMGAGFLTKGYTNLLSFMAEFGLDQRLYKQHGSSAIFRDGNVRAVTPGALLGNQLLSWGAKAHALPLLLKTFAGWRNLDAHAFWKADKYDDRSVADMFVSQGGKEFLEYALQPMFNGYFYWTPEHTSEAMLRILCKAAFSHGTYKMEGGLQRIPEKAVKESQLLLGHTVKRVQQTPTGYSVIAEYDGKERVVRADGIICATTATVVPKIFSDLTDLQKSFFKSVQYSSGALIARTYRQDQTRGDRAIAFPRIEGTELSAVTLSPEPGSGNTTYATIKTYASGAVAAKLGNLSDQEMQNSLVTAMEPAHDLVFVGKPRPVATHVQRWQEALPFFDIGHFKRLRQFANGEIEDQDRPVTFAGDYIGGPFMEGAFASGVQAAERLDARLRNK
jgi:oxygen-dependent protoporphyrinogen oxidase